MNRRTDACMTESSNAKVSMRGSISVPISTGVSASTIDVPGSGVSSGLLPI